MWHSSSVVITLLYSVYKDQDRYGNPHGYNDDDACIGQMTLVPIHFARTIDDIVQHIYQFHTQLLKLSYLRQLVVKSVRVFHRLSTVPPTCPNRPRSVISRQNASRRFRTAGQKLCSKPTTVENDRHSSKHHGNANVAKETEFP